MKSKLREEIEAITPEGDGVSAEEAARTRDMLIACMKWKARETQIEQAKQVQSPEKKS